MKAKVLTLTVRTLFTLSSDGHVDLSQEIKRLTLYRVGGGRPRSLDNLRLIRDHSQWDFPWGISF